MSFGHLECAAISAVSRYSVPDPHGQSRSFLNMADGEGAEPGKKYYDHLCKYLEGCEDAIELSKTNVEKCKNKIVNTESACGTTIRKVDI